MPDDFSPLFLSLRTALAATLFCFVLGLSIAGLRQKLRGIIATSLDTIFLLPLVLPPSAVGLALLLFLGKQGPLGAWLNAWQVSVIFSWPATVITATVSALPLMYLTSRAGLEQVDRSCLEAAQIQGAGRWTCFYRIAAPLAAPSIGAGLLLSFGRALGEFGATLMLAGNIPGKTQTIPIAIFFAIEGGNETQAIFWTATITGISLLVVLAFNLFPRHFR